MSWTAAESEGAEVVDYDVRYRENGASPAAAWIDWPHRGTATLATIRGDTVVVGTEYEVQVRAINSRCSGNWTASATVTPTAGQPVGPPISAVGGIREITVNWSEPANNTGGVAIDNYDIRYRLTDTISWTTIEDRPPAERSYTITGLADGTGYVVEVRASNPDHDGVWAAAAVITLDVPAKPALTLSKASSTSLEADWTVATDGTPKNDALGPIWSTSLTAGELAGWTGWSASFGSVLDDDFTYDGTTYTLVAVTHSPSHNAILINPGSTQPVLSTDVHGEYSRLRLRVDTTWYRLKWMGGNTNRYETDSVDSPFTSGSTYEVALGGLGITGYEVRHRADGGTWPTTATSVTASPHTITGLTDGTTYEVQVRAQNAVGWSDWSDTQEETSGGLRPDAPVLTVTPGNVKLDLSWTVPSGNGSAITGYNIQYRVKTTNDWSQWTHTGTGTTATITGLTNDTAYVVRVGATNTNGSGSFSESVEASPASDSIVPSKPRNLTLAPANQKITASWTEPANDGGLDITSYELRFREVGASSWNSQTGLTSTTYEITPVGAVNPANGEEWEVRVRAANAKGNGNYTDSVMAVVNPPLTSGNLVHNLTLVGGTGNPADITIDEGSLITGQGSSNAYTISLKTQPYAPVTVEIRATEGATVETPSLVFTPSNWSTPQSAMVRGAYGADRTADVTVTHSARGGGYDGQSFTATITQVTDTETLPGRFTANTQYTASSNLDAEIRLEWPDSISDTSLTKGGTATVERYRLRYRLASPPNSPWIKDDIYFDGDESHFYRLGKDSARRDVVLKNGVTYNIQLQAGNKTGFNTDWWPSIESAARGTSSPPQNFTVTAHWNRLEVSAEKPEDIATTGEVQIYHVQYREVGATGNPTQVTRGANNPGAPNPQGLDDEVVLAAARRVPGTEYEVRVRARTHDNGEWSFWKSVIIPSRAVLQLSSADIPDTFTLTTAGAPDGVTVGTNLPTSGAGVRIVAANASGGGTVSLDGSCPGTANESITGKRNDDAITLLGCAKGETTINLYDGSGTTALATYTVTVADPLAAPTGFNALGANTEATLNWSAPHDETITRWEYDVKSDSSDTTDDWVEIPGGGTKRSFTLTSLTNGTTYTFKVRAVAGTAVGAATGTDSATPTAPPSSGETEHWSATLTAAGFAGGQAGYKQGNAGCIDPATFTHSGTTYTVSQLFWWGNNVVLELSDERLPPRHRRPGEHGEAQSHRIVDHDRGSSGRPLGGR